MAQHGGSLTGSLCQWNFTSKAQSCRFFFPSTILANSNLNMKLCSADSGFAKKEVLWHGKRRKQLYLIVLRPECSSSTCHVPLNYIKPWSGCGRLVADGHRGQQTSHFWQQQQQQQQEWITRMLHEVLGGTSMQLFVKNYWCNNGKVAVGLCVCAEEQAPGEGDEMRSWAGEVLEWAVGFLYALAVFTATLAPCTLTCGCKGASLRPSAEPMHQWLMRFWYGSWLLCLLIWVQGSRLYCVGLSLLQN